MTSFQSFKLAGTGVLSALFLSACGGGGGGGSSTPPTVHSDLTYTLGQNFQDRIDAGATDSFTVKGGCIGNATITIDPTRPISPPWEDTVGGVHASKQVSTLTLQCPQVPDLSGTTTGDTYYNSDYSPVGLHAVKGSTVLYAVADGQPAPLPPTAKSGDAGQIGRQILYNSTTKATKTGERVLSYAVRDAYSATTVFVDMTITTYKTDGTTLVSSETSTYLMADDHSLTLESIVAQFYSPIEYKLVYSK